MKLFADSRLTRADFDRIAADRGARPFRARKATRVAARRATAVETVVTRWNGVETTNSASPGDWIVTALDADGALLRDGEAALNMWVVGPDDFAERYAPAPPVAEPGSAGVAAQGALYDGLSVVDAIPLADGFDIVAPWGERQTGGAGYLIRSGDDVYGVAAEPFEETYKREA